jgi:Zn ribbon nucleic-acid-binding protein
MPDVHTTHGRYAQPPERDLAHLGPILPACPGCGAMQYWHNHATDVWECWDCVPPGPRDRQEHTVAAQHDAAPTLHGGGGVAAHD